MASRTPRATYSAPALFLCAAIAACGGSADQVEDDVIRASTVNGVGAPGLILTFDDGPRVYVSPVVYKGADGSQTSVGSSADLAEWLQKRGVKATFFMVGALASSKEGIEQLKRIAAAGHTIGNHTFSHFTSPAFGRRALLTQEDEIEKADTVLFAEDATFSRNLLRSAAGKQVVFLRTPGGSWDKLDAPALNAKFGARYVGPIHWDIGGDAPAADFSCWATKKTVAECTQLYRDDIVAHGEAGIVLLHDSISASALVAMTLVDEHLKSGKKFYSLADAPRVRTMMNSTTGFSERFSLPDGRGGDATTELSSE